MGIQSLDSRITVGDFVQGLRGKFQKLLASSMSAEDKLAAIIRTMTAEVQEKRVLAREIGAKMRAISDPDTATLEPLDAAKARREKLIALGAKHVDDKDKSRLGQISQEVKAVDALIESQQATYDTLKESYDLAFGNYQTALSALESARSNGPAMIAAIRAHQQALEVRDRANAQSAQSVDVTFMNDLAQELSQNQAKLRSDKDLDQDLDATKKGSVDKELARLDAQSIDAGLMAEFEAAAGGKKKKR